MSTVTRVYSGVRGISSAIKDMQRLREIVAVLARHGFGAVVQRLRVPDETGIDIDADALSREADRVSRGVRIRKVIEELGPTFIKLGQILSTRPDLIPRDIIDEISHLQDRVPPLPYEVVKAEVERELGRSLVEMFGDFQLEPLACASIAQVHRATLLDSGREVVVKVQRPNLEPLIDADLNVLSFFARQAEKLIPELEMMDPVGVVAEFEKALHKELDFTNERNNIGRFHANLAGMEGVCVPEVFERYCSKRVLTMEFLRGIKVTQAAQEMDVDPYPIARRMLRILFKMVFQDGYFHGDLHPGNILIAPDSTIQLIDFGLVGRLTEQQRDNVMDILIAISRQDYRAVARIYFDLGIKVRGVTYDYEAFEADVTEVMERHVADKTLVEIDIGAFFGDLVAGAIRHRIKMPPNYTMVFKALMTVEGIGKQLAPQINFIEEAQPFVRDILIERYDPKRLMKEGVDVLNSLSRFLRVFPHVATHLLLDAQKGALTIRVQNDALDRWNEEYLITARRQTQVLGFGACVVAGSIALQTGSMRIFGINVVAAGLFVAAAWLGFPLFFTRLRWKQDRRDSK